MTTLADREAGPPPDRSEFGPYADYETAWHNWHALYRDSRPNPAEDEVIRDLYAERFDPNYPWRWQ